MEDGGHCSKKARVQQAAIPNALVKREEREVLQGGSEGARAVVAAEAMAESPQIDGRMDVALLHCQACLLPLKAPIFKCEAAGHIVCCHCRRGHGEVCSRAGTHCSELDAFVGAFKLPCAYKEFGCESYAVYHDAADHYRACPCAPCSCPEPSCAFLGSRPMLLDHFAGDHSRPVITVRYGRSWDLSLPLSRLWHVLVGEEDRSVFLVSLRALGTATAVSLVCVRADGAAAALQFWCKLSVELPGEDKDKLVLMASAVSSSDLSRGVPAPGLGMFLAVPQELISGDMLPLSIRIDQLRPAAAATTKSTTPQAKTSRKMH